MSRKSKILKKQQKISRAILAHSEELAEKMNLRLFFSTGEENLLWVESVTIIDIVYPEIPEKSRKWSSIKQMISETLKKLFRKERRDFYANSK